MLNEFNFIFGNDQIHMEFDQNGIVWFYGPEIAKALEYSEAHHMYRMIQDNEKLTAIKWLSGQNREITMINEFGVYRCIFNSRSPKAEEFRNKVFYDILPSIRRYGVYIDPETRSQLDANPNLIHDLNAHIQELENKPRNKLMTIPVDKSFGIDKRYAEAIQLNQEQSQYIQDNMPYTVLGQAVAVENGDITIDMLAHILQMSGYPTGTNRMYEELRLDGFLNKFNGMYNHPTQATIDAGLMRWICRTDATGTYTKVYITPKGQEYFVNFYMSKLSKNSKTDSNE